ncbi:MAG: adenylosuccinate lyase [Clostridiales bacterium]|jgi:adenylosuccinate lyase|nr:adenylosuccinate lyase [Clostridiales bacterium]
MKEEKYQDPFTDRYASEQMLRLFSSLHQAKVWRALWIALAKTQKDLGLNITRQQIDDLKKFKEDIDFCAIEKYEKQTRHDCFAHILAYGEQAKLAKPILHLGATSCFVKDNADLIIFRDALQLIKVRLLQTMQNLSEFAFKYKDLPTLGWTHLQPAQLTTVGKRAALWLYDLKCDYDLVCQTISSLKLRGAKGTTGTQASFLELFNGDEKKVNRLDRQLANEFEFDGVYPLTGQTYSRKVDYQILCCLSSIAQSASKFGCDLRLLMSLKELEEPFEIDQIGSSAMAYKRNPMRSERLCSLARFAISLPINASVTASTQWLERTLDDSANRRISMTQGFLSVDSILNLYLDITSNLVVYEKIIEKNIRAELPFMVTENIIMQGVAQGGDRQQLHEAIRKHSMESSKSIKLCGQPCDLIERLKSDVLFKKILHKFDEILLPKNYTGMASVQTAEFINQVISPLLKDHEHVIRKTPKAKISI